MTENYQLTQAFEPQRPDAFQEGRTLSVTLEHTNVEAFGLFLEWLYTTQIVIRSPEPNESFSDMCKRKVGFNKALVDLWILADYLQIPKLQNLIIDKILENYGDGARRRIPALFGKFNDICMYFSIYYVFGMLHGTSTCHYTLLRVHLPKYKTCPNCTR